jgi:hypothetical protein
MRSYRVFDAFSDIYRPTFWKLQEDAHKEAKRLDSQQCSHHEETCVRIELVELATDADAIHRYLAGDLPENLSALRTWGLTKRGGLMELKADGIPAKASNQESEANASKTRLLAGTPEAAKAAEDFFASLGKKP